MSIKAERIGSNFVREISEILRDEVHDETIKNVSITHVKVTDDLSFAKVYFTSFFNNDVVGLTKSLNKASSFIRGELSQRVDLRHTPEIEFIYDDSIDYGIKIENIIDEIHDKE